MSLSEHLAELYKRLIRAGAGLIIGMVAGWFASDLVLNALRGPIEELAATQHRVAQLNYDSITGAFDLKIQIAFTVGVVVSSPIWLYQVWAYFLPALTRRETKFALSFFFTAVPLFLAGCAAGWLVVPHIVLLMTSFANQADAAFIQAKDYADFVLKLVVAVGVAFVLPVFLVLFNMMGVVSGRAILRSWRWALIVIVLFTAIATPSADVMSMFLLAIPMIVLFFSAAGFSILHDRRLERRSVRLESTLSGRQRGQLDGM